MRFVIPIVKTSLCMMKNFFHLCMVDLYLIIYIFSGSGFVNNQILFISLAPPLKQKNHEQSENYQDTFANMIL
jgi:hypothetical protein